VAEYVAAQASVLLVPSTDGFLKTLRAKLEPELEKYRPEVTVKPVLDKKALAEMAAEIEAAKNAGDKGRVEVKVGLDDGSVTKMVTELQAIKKAIEDRPVEIKVKTDETDRARAKISQLDKDLAGFSSQATKGVLMRVAILGLPEAIAGLASLNTGVVQLTQSALLLPGVFAAAGSVLATFATGISGVKAALQAANKEQDSAVTTAQKYADQQRSLTEAQNSLNRAYKDAKRNLEDLYAQMRDAPLDVAEAQIRLDEARIEAAKKWGKTGLQQQEDLLAVARAQNALSDAQRKGQRVAEDFNEANAKGITGADQVVTATDRLQKAMEQLNNTMSQTSFDKAMAKLSPQTQAFVNQLLAMRTQWDAFRNEVSGHLFAGMADEVKQLGGLLPTVQGGFDRIADSLNNNVKTAIAAITSKGSKSLLDQIFGNTANAQKILSGAINPLTHGFLQLAATGTDALPRLATGFTNLANRFNSFISKAAQNGDLQKWIDEGIKAVDNLGSSLLNAGKILHDLSDIFTAAGGKGLLELLKDGTDHLHQFLTSAEGSASTKQFFEDVLTSVRKWQPLLKDIPGLFRNIVTASVQIGGVMLPLLTKVADVLSSTNPIIQGIITAFLGWYTIGPIVSAAGRFIDNFTTSMRKASNEAGAEGSGGRGLKGRLSGLAGFLKSAGWTAAIFAGTEAIDKLGDAHRKAAQAAEEQDNKLKALAGTLNTVTGNATSATIGETAKNFGSYKLPSGKTVDLNSDARGLGINPSDAVAAAADPTQQGKKDQILGQLDQQAQAKIEASDAYKRSKPFWDAAGIDSKTLAKAANADPDAVAKVQQAMKTPVDKLPFGGGVANQLLRGLFHITGGGDISAEQAKGDKLGGLEVPDLGDLSNIVGAPSSLAIGIRDTSKKVGDQARADANSSDIASGAPKGWQLNPNNPFAAYGPDPHPRVDAAGNAFITLNNPPGTIPDSWSQNGWTVDKDVSGGRVTIEIPKEAAGQYLSKVPGFASGGMMMGAGSGTSDSMLARVSNGEFIANSSSVKKYGPDLFHALNNGTIDPSMLPGFDSGDLVQVPLTPPPPIPNPTPTPGQLFVPGAGDVTPPSPPLPIQQLPATPKVGGPTPGLGLTPSPNATLQENGKNLPGTTAPGTGLTPSPNAPQITGIDPSQANTNLGSDLSPGTGNTPPAAPGKGLADIGIGSLPIAPSTPITPPGADAPAPPAPLTPGPGDLLGGLGKVFNPANILSRLAQIFMGAIFGFFGLDPQPILGMIQQLTGGSDGIINRVLGQADPSVQGVLDAQPGRNQQFDPGKVAALPGANGPDSAITASPSAAVTPGGPLNPKSSQADVARAIVAEAHARGYSAEQTQAILSAGLQESGLSPTASGGGGAWHGIFQQDGGYPGRDDPNLNIKGFFDRLGSHGGSQGDIWKNIFWLQQRPGEGSADSAFANGRQAYLDEIKSKLGPAQALYGQLAATVAAAPPGAAPGTGLRTLSPSGLSFLQNPASQASSLTLGGSTTDAFDRAVKSGKLTNGPLYTPGLNTGGYGNSKGVPDWAVKMGAEFGLAPSTYPDGGTLHQRGYAFDFAPIAGNPDPVGSMDRFAQFITDNLQGQTLELIHANSKENKYWGIAGGQRVGRGTNNIPGYFASDWTGHDDFGPEPHVHWATDVAPQVFSPWYQKVPGHATGGMLRGPGNGTSDSILARVSDGEFITKAAAVQKYGPEFFHALNQGAIDPGMLPGFADGGQPNDPNRKKALQDLQDAQKLQQSGGPLNQDATLQHQLPQPDQSPQDAQKLQPPPDNTGSIMQMINPPQAQAPGQIQASLPGMGGGAADNGPGGDQPPPTPPVTDQSPQPGASAPTGASETPDPRSIPGPTIPNAQQNHNIPWLDNAVKSGINYAGQIGATVVGAAGGAAPVPGAGAASAAAGMAISQGAQVIAEDASAALNVLSSLGVGTLTPGTTAGAYGSPLLPQQQDASLSGPKVVNNYGDIHTASYEQFYQGQQRRESQQQAPYINALL
jgi:hypothetical protein